MKIKPTTHVIEFPELGQLLGDASPEKLSWVRIISLAPLLNPTDDLLHILPNPLPILQSFEIFPVARDIPVYLILVGIHHR